MGNKLEKQQRKLRQRQERHDRIRKNKEAYKRPGSLNKAKQK